MSRTDVIIVTPTLEAAVLADNDVFFNPVEIPNAVRIPGGRSTLRTILVVDGDDQAVDFDLVFSQVSTNLGTLNGAVSIADADLLKATGIVSLLAVNSIDMINSILYQVPGPLPTHPFAGIMMEAAADQTSLYVGGIIRSGTPDYTAAGMQIKLGFEKH